jgi:hypothetical protein
MSALPHEVRVAIAGTVQSSVANRLWCRIRRGRANCDTFQRGELAAHPADDRRLD